MGAAVPTISKIVLRDGKFDNEQGGSQEALDSIFAGLRQSKPSKIVVHFHGGLVDYASASKSAEELDPIYRATGASPIFFIWESGWKEIISQKLSAIAQEDIFQKARTYLTRFAKGKIDKATDPDKGKSTALPLTKESIVENELAAPANEVEPFADVDPHTLPAGDRLTEDEKDQLKDRMKADPDLEILLQDIANQSEQDEGGAVAKGATAGTSKATLMDADVLREILPPEERSKGIVSSALFIAKCVYVLEQIVARYSKRRDHGFYVTIVEEILRNFYVGNAGKFLWDGMKQSTEKAFVREADCGGTQFLAALGQLWTEYQPTIVLVGHSAGSIFICNLLQEAQRRKLPADLKFQILLIAPACTFDLFASTLDMAKERITGLRIFGMGDPIERKDAIAGPLFPSSLLYLVSGVFEKEGDEPLLGMARYHSGDYIAGTFKRIGDARGWGPFTKDHVTNWSMSIGDGTACDMVSHGRWTAAAKTVGSVQYVLRQGL